MFVNYRSLVFLSLFKVIPIIARVAINPQRTCRQLGFCNATVPLRTSLIRPMPSVDLSRDRVNARQVRHDVSLEMLG